MSGKIGTLFRFVSAVACEINLKASFSNMSRFVRHARLTDYRATIKLSMPPGMKGILCIKFDLFKIKNTDLGAAYVKTLLSSLYVCMAKKYNLYFDHSSQLKLLRSL